MTARSITLRFLGTGAAEPIPSPGCGCAACAHARIDSTARRAQSGLAVVYGGGQYVIDCGPGAVILPHWVDLPLKAVLLSHLHPDHALGLYTLRWARQVRPVPALLPPDTAQRDEDGLEHETVRLENWLALEPRRPEAYTPLTIDGMEVVPLKLDHGATPTHGYLLEAAGVKIAYLIDGKGLPPRTAAVLSERKPIDCVVVDATYRPGRLDSRHNNVDEAIELGIWSEARLVVLTHFGHHNLAAPEIEAHVARRTAAVARQQFVCARDGLTVALGAAAAVDGTASEPDQVVSRKADVA